MMTDNYLNMKEVLKLLILSSQIIYDHMEIIQYQHLFICLSIYLFIHSFIYSFIYSFICLFINLFIWYITSVQFLCVQACHLIKLPPVNLSPEAFS